MLLTIDQAAKKLQVNPATIRRWIKNKQLQAIELPGGIHYRKFRVDEDTIKAMLLQAENINAVAS